MFKKTLRISFLFFLSLILAGAIGCFGGGDGDGDDSKDITINGYVNGSGAALNNAAVKIGEESEATGESGKFSIEVSSDDSVETNSGTIFTVEVTADGYGTGYAKVVYIDGTTEYSTEIKLLAVTDAITDGDDITNGVDIKQSGTTVGEITIPEGSFPAGVTKITGKVTYIDPTTPDIDSAPGGDFLAVRTADPNNTVSLDSLGMMEFELQDQDGNPVTQLQGAGATLKMKVPSGVTASIGETIPLWWYNTETGLWQEDGSGKVISEDGQLWITGTVTHFSWWNYDRPIESHACFEFSIVDSATNIPVNLSWYVEGVSYTGTAPSRQCSCGGTNWSTFTVMRSSQVRVYAKYNGVRYYLVEDTPGTAYSISTDAGNAKVFNAPSEQGSCRTGTLNGTSFFLDGQDGILPLGGGGINYAPVISAISSDTPNPVSQGVTIQLTSTVTDPEGDAITVSWEMISGGSTISPDSESFTGGTATAAFTIPAVTSVGTYGIRISATDSNGNVSTVSTAIWAQGNGIITGRIRCGGDCGPGIDTYDYLPGATVELFITASDEEVLFGTVTSDSQGNYTMTGVPTNEGDGDGDFHVDGYIKASFTNDGTTYVGESYGIYYDGGYDFTADVDYVGGGGT
ncbi:MAG: PKD domain-containing protein [bacterium]|nr:PKD domain-containing protein [bacterium]